MLAIASASTSYTLNSVSSYHAATAARPQLNMAQPMSWAGVAPFTPRSALARAHVVASASTADATARLDALLRSGDVEAAITLLANDEPLEMTPARTASMIDAACRGPPPAPGSSTGFARMLETFGEEPEAVQARQRATQAEEEVQQQLLVRCYGALSKRGVLRGYGSADGALPAPTPKVVTTDEQQRLTGLPTSAFAPGKGNGGGTLVAGALSALALTSAASSFGWDLQAPFQAAGGALLLDRLLLRGAAGEAVTKLVQPAYARTVLQHEAGHFLVAYLLGCPVEAVLLDGFQAMRDGRFAAGTAGTVFFDPELGAAMKRGELPRSAVDRYSVVVLAGIAAEAQQNGRAEGGQADEAALVQLLSSLDGGKSWDIPRIQNQARWGASQAVLLLREHEAAFAALCEALERGASVGECMVAIEAALATAELPTAGRRALRAERAAEAAAAEEEGRVTQAHAAVTAAVAAPKLSAEMAEAQATRKREMAARLAQIDERLGQLN